MATFRKGDKVTVQATVKYRYDDGNVGDVYLDIDGHYTSISLPASKLTLSQSHFEVGDWVLWDDENRKGQIIALNESLAWVRCYFNAVHCTTHIGELTHADAPAEDVMTGMTNASKVAWTPGPWLVNSRLPRMIEADVPGIADGHDSYRLAEACFHSLITTDEAAANARLIAAAPELYAMLENLVEFCEEVFVKPAECTDLIGAKAALAKASGAQS